MKHYLKNVLTMIPLLILLASCGEGMPQLFWETNDKTPDYARASGAATSQADARKHLEVPPELRARIGVPMEDQVAVQDSKELPEKYRQAVAGKAVSLDARVYPLAAAEVFSAVVDAMTSLNLPVDSVDSPSGIVTTDWVRKGANNASIAAMFGYTSGTMTRHRFIVRVFRLQQTTPATKLEIRLLGQSYENGHWVNKPFKRTSSEELFQRIEEVLGLKREAVREQQQAAEIPESE